MTHPPLRALFLASLLSTPAFAGSFFEPLFNPDNRWVMRLEGEKKLDFELSVTVSTVGSTQVSTISFKPVDGAAAGDAAWVPSKLCLARTPKGIFWLAVCSAPELKHALKGKAAIGDPPVAYARAPKALEGDLPRTESVAIAREQVLGTEVKVVSYAFTEDTGFKAKLAEGVGFVALDWDLQDGGGALRLQRFTPAAAAPVTASSYEALGIDAAGKASLEEAGGALQVTGGVGSDEPVTVLLRAEGGQTELQVRDATGKLRFSKRYKKHPPRGLRYEPATGEVTVFFSLGAKRDVTAKVLGADGKSYALGAMSQEGE